MNHLFVGAMLPFFIAAALYVKRGFRASLRLLILTPVFMAFGSTWAVFPDLPRIAGWHRLAERLAGTDPRIDIFFWHYTLNLHETGSPWYAVGFVLMLGCLLLAAWRELYVLEEE